MAVARRGHPGDLTGCPAPDRPFVVIRADASRRGARTRHARNQRRDHGVIRSHFSQGDIGSSYDADIGSSEAASASDEAEIGTSASACAALSVQEMTTMQSALVADVGTELKEGEQVSGIMSMILSPIIMMMIMGSRGSSSKKASPGAGATVVDVIVLVMTIPVCLSLAKALAYPMVNILANIIGEDLVSELPDKLVKEVKLHAGYVVAQNLVVIIVNYLQNELGPVMAFMIATFLTGTLPTAITDAVTTGVTNLLLPKLTNALSGPVMNYYYCIYCYYYGDFCQQCFYDNDLTWMDRDWWLSPQQDAYT